MQNNISTKTSRSMRKRRKNKQKLGIILKCIALAACLVVLCILIPFLTKNDENSDDTSDESKKTTAQNESPTTPANTKSFTALDSVDSYAEISKYFTYGTSLCINAGITDENYSNITSISFVLKPAYTDTSSADTQPTYTFEAYYDAPVGSSFEVLSYEDINKGINLENFSDGEYCLLLKVDYNDNSSKYFSLKNTSVQDDICYYTLTKNGSNQKIDILPAAYEDKNYFAFNIAKATLPDDVYDIVLDAGHGGSDPGAINGSYHEADFTIDYVKDLKKELEALGYKVLLTRTGDEASDAPLGYNMYEEDGRVNVACASKAKLCLSLHLNSNAEALRSGGVQVYVSYRADFDTAYELATEISNHSGTNLSSMVAFKIIDGVYTRALSSYDIESSREDAKEDGYEYYNATTDTDYYYMIRELGGIATNAYVDGRNPAYGKNLYYDSNQGVESYIIELGFISVDADLQNLISNKKGYIDGIVSAITNTY